MKLQLLLVVCALSLFTACNHRNQMGEEPVNGSYGDAGRAAGVKPVDPNVHDTNLLTSPSNTLHRVAE